MKKIDLLITLTAHENDANNVTIGEPFKPIKELLSEYLAAGGRIAVCSSCMKHNGVDEKNLIAGAEVVTADFVVDGIMAAEKSLKLN